MLRAFELAEAEDWDALTELYHPDADGEAPPGWPETVGPDDHGRDALIRQFKRLWADWSEARIVVEETAERDEFAVVRARWIVKGRASGVPGEIPFSSTTRFEGGLIREVRFFWDHDEALDAAGLTAADTAGQ